MAQTAKITVLLTPGQVAVLEHSRHVHATCWQAAQAEITAGTDPGAAYAAQLGAAAWQLGELLALVDGFTAAEPEADDEPEPVDYDPGPECDDEGGMSEYRHTTVPEDYR